LTGQPWLGLGDILFTTRDEGSQSKTLPVFERRDASNLAEPFTEMALLVETSVGGHDRDTLVGLGQQTPRRLHTQC
jgi:hypothetical protein